MRPIDIHNGLEFKLFSHSETGVLFSDGTSSTALKQSDQLHIASMQNPRLYVSPCVLPSFQQHAGNINVCTEF